MEAAKVVSLTVFANIVDGDSLVVAAAVAVALADNIVVVVVVVVAGQWGKESIVVASTDKCPTLPTTEPRPATPWNKTTP